MIFLHCSCNRLSALVLITIIIYCNHSTRFDAYPVLMRPFWVDHQVTRKSLVIFQHNRMFPLLAARPDVLARRAICRTFYAMVSIACC